MGSVLGIVYNNREIEKKKNLYEIVNNDEKKINPEYLSYESRIKQYFLQLKYGNNNLTLYKNNIVDNRETHQRKLNSLLLKEVKDEGQEIQNNIYLYKNYVYKFSQNNNLSIIQDIYNLNIKNVLLPRYIYSKKENNQYLEIFDYYENGDLFTYLFEKNNNVSFYEKINIFKKIVNIIVELHKNDYTHRDIKCENILVDIDSNGEIQPILIDLDYAMKSYQYLHFRGGTSMYVAPEIINTNKSSYSFKSTDIWSLGVLFHIMLYSEPLWYVPHIDDTNFNIYSSFRNCYPGESYWRDVVIENNQKNNIPESYSNKIQKILDYCLDFNYSSRTDVRIVLNILNE
tara:strand:- start:478 stop:1506 length:1029 start_codon:yes stop_codon:yes gene_type:complete